MSSSDRHAQAKCQVCNKTMRADNLKRHLASHYKGNATKELTPEQAEKNRESAAVFSIASAIWDDFELDDDIDFSGLNKSDRCSAISEALDHFDKCVRRKHYDAWIYSEGIVKPPPKKYNKETVCPFCLVHEWREVLQKAADSLKAEQKQVEVLRVMDEKRQALAKAQEELARQMEELKEIPCS